MSMKITAKNLGLEEHRNEYRNFLLSDKGKAWEEEKKASGMDGDYGDYLYDFYPEYLQ